MKVKKAIPEYLEYVKAMKTDGTYRFYSEYLNRISHYMGDKKVSKIGRSDILSFIKVQQERNPDIKNATLNKYVLVIKALYKYVTNKNLEYPKLKEKQQTIQVIPQNTIDLIFNYYESHLNNKVKFRNYLFLRILLDTGVRLNEAINIRTKNVDTDENCILIEVTKTDVDRYVLFTSETATLLKQYLALYGQNEYLYYDFNTGLPMTTSSVECFVYRLRKKLRIKNSITPHKWRHTFATRFQRADGSIEVLRILLGHSNIKTTQRYLHLDKNDLQREYKGLMDKKSQPAEYIHPLA